jgi:hypothetical protein
MQTDSVKPERFAKGLEKLDWVGGRNIRIHLRWARGDPEQIRLLA